MSGPARLRKRRRVSHTFGVDAFMICGGSRSDRRPLWLRWHRKCAGQRSCVPHVSEQYCSSPPDPLDTATQTPAAQSLPAAQLAPRSAAPFLFFRACVLGGRALALGQGALDERHERVGSRVDGARRVVAAPREDTEHLGGGRVERRAAARSRPASRARAPWATRSPRAGGRAGLRRVPPLSRGEQAPADRAKVVALRGAGGRGRRAAARRRSACREGAGRCLRRTSTRLRARRCLGRARALRPCQVVADQDAQRPGLAQRRRRRRVWPEHDARPRGDGDAVPSREHDVGGDEVPAHGRRAGRGDRDDGRVVAPVGHARRGRDEVGHAARCRRKRRRRLSGARHDQRQRGRRALTKGPWQTASARRVPRPRRGSPLLDEGAALARDGSGVVPRQGSADSGRPRRSTPPGGPGHPAGTSKVDTSRSLAQLLAFSASAAASSSSSGVLPRLDADLRVAPAARADLAPRPPGAALARRSVGTGGAPDHSLVARRLALGRRRPGTSARERSIPDIASSPASRTAFAAAVSPRVAKKSERSRSRPRHDDLRGDRDGHHAQREDEGEEQRHGPRRPGGSRVCAGPPALRAARLFGSRRPCSSTSRAWRRLRSLGLAQLAHEVPLGLLAQLLAPPGASPPRPGASSARPGLPPRRSRLVLAGPRLVLLGLLLEPIADHASFGTCASARSKPGAGARSRARAAPARARCSRAADRGPDRA